MRECLKHWSFADLNLDSQVKQDEFFKPSADGCACAFESLSLKITSEITPLGITNYSPKDWDIIESLSPADFHKKCWENDKKVLIDVRNHYESRIGYFVEPVTGVKAIMPEVRRFSQFPLYVKTHLTELEGLDSPTNILTYCTGGIRCEKSVGWLRGCSLPLVTK
jgi:predicted sulfurtransferase